MFQTIFYLIIGFIAFVVYLAVFPAVGKNRCTDRWAESGLPAKYESFQTGCMVQVNGRWIPEANVQIVAR